MIGRGVHLLFDEEVLVSEIDSLAQRHAVDCDHQEVIGNALNYQGCGLVGHWLASISH